MHPTLLKLYNNILLPHFEKDILINQELLDREDSQTKLLSLISDEPIKNKILSYIQDNTELTAKEKWDYIKNTVIVHTNFIYLLF